MKSMIALALALLMLLSLTACGAKKEAENTAASTESTELANPWSEAETAEAASEGAGVGALILPANETETSGGRLDFRAFRYMKGIAQADGFIGTAELTVRKGLKSEGEDVSGDYTAYKYGWTQEVGKTSVNCYGNEEGRAMKAVWSAGEYSYSFTVRGQGDIHDSYGIDADAVTALVSSVA